MMHLFLSALALLCSPSAFFSAASTNEHGNRRNDDVTLPDLVALVQQQASVIQRQSADIQALQTEVRGLKSSGTSRDSQIHTLQKKVAFTARFTEGGDINIGQSAPIAFSQAVFNEGQGYNAVTGVFTAPQTGTYLFLLQVKSSVSAGGTTNLEIVRSGISLAMLTVPEDSSNFHLASISAVTRAKAGEQVFVRHASGATVIDKWKATSFTGVLLYADEASRTYLSAGADLL